MSAIKVAPFELQWGVTAALIASTFSIDVMSLARTAGPLDVLSLSSDLFYRCGSGYLAPRPKEGDLRSSILIALTLFACCRTFPCPVFEQSPLSFAFSVDPCLAVEKEPRAAAFNLSHKSVRGWPRRLKPFRRIEDDRHHFFFLAFSLLHRFVPFL